CQKSWPLIINFNPFHLLPSALSAPSSPPPSRHSIYPFGLLILVFASSDRRYTGTGPGISFRYASVSRLPAPPALFVRSILYPVLSANPRPLALQSPRNNTKRLDSPRISQGG
ncbi:hypothetical protein BOTBODRAFT_145394, partial [Botryobasidium botryosum FD-172 SS1]